jgi:tRNA G18 (ribose-2'-O)-methylase SpoU
MGEVFAVPYAVLPSWPSGLSDLRAAGFTLLALTPRTDAVPLQRLGSLRPAKPALLFGAEGGGLSPAALAACDICVTIPMARRVDSLNVAAAAAVAFWELCREGPPHL